MPSKLIVVVIDGLTPAMLESAIDAGRAPTLAFLAAHGRYGLATSVFPSLTPVCLSSIATGAYPDVHEIPHLVWWHRRERRLVEYGSSFGAMRAAGAMRSIQDTIFEMNASHLGARATTLFEAVEDAGLVAGAVNFTCYRGRTAHRPTVRALRRVARGPRRFFYYSLFESDPAGTPLAVRNRAGGSVDAYAAAAGRWLVTRDGFDLLVYYLSDYDYASHASGPDAAHDVLARCDAAVGDLVAAAGGPDEFLERYAVILLADHGQTRVERVTRLEERYEGVEGALVAASNRAGQVYALEACRLDPRELAARLDGDPDVEVALFREGGEALARREGEELRFAPRPDGTWARYGDAAILEGPNALERAWRALANPNAGEVLVSPAPGVELADLGGRHHLGGGSHGSLAAGDSLVPAILVGVDGRLDSITDVAPLALAHLGVAPAPARAA